MTVSSIAQLLLLFCLLLSGILHGATATEASPADPITYDAADLKSLLQALEGFAAPNDDDSPNIYKRQVAGNSSSFNMTDFCRNYSDVLPSQVHSSCLESLQYLSRNTGNAAYLASDFGRYDVDTVCREDCAGVLLEFEEACPGYFLNLADYLHGVCSKNENVERCAFAILENDGSRVNQRCYMETNTLEQCRARCKNALRDFSSEIGCCINTHYNDTYSFSGLSSSLPNLNYSIDPRLWNTCGIPYPDECSPNLFSPEPSTPVIIVAPTPTPKSTPTPLTPSLCSGLEDSFIFGNSCLSLLLQWQTPAGLQSIAKSSQDVSDLCSINCAGSYVEQCTTDVDRVSAVLELFCGQYNNQYCGGVIADSYPTLLETLSHCNTPNISTSSNMVSCSMDCHSALVEVESSLGCCAYALTQTSVSETAGITLVESHLWSSCGLELPQRCPDPFLSPLEDLETTGSSNRGL